MAGVNPAYVENMLKENAEKERYNHGKDLYDLVSKLHGITPDMSLEQVIEIIDEAFRADTISFIDCNLLIAWVKDNNVHKFKRKAYRRGKKVYVRKSLLENGLKNV